MQATNSHIDALAARMTTIENRQLAIIVKLDDLVRRITVLENNHDKSVAKKVLAESGKK